MPVLPGPAFGATLDALVLTREQRLEPGAIGGREHRDLVGVREVAHLIGDRPPRCRRGPRPLLVGEPIEDLLQHGGLELEVAGEVVHRDRQRQRPFHCGGRRSPNARGPSWASSLRYTGSQIASAIASSSSRWPTAAR